MLIVSAANEAFAPMLKGLVASLFQWGPQKGVELGIMDLGLGPETLEWLRGYTATIVKPGWDLPVDAALAREKPYLQGFTARPFIPRHFPGHDLYLWIDADAWVQAKFALEWFAEAAGSGELAIVPQVHQSYVHRIGRWRWRMKNLREYFGEMTWDRLLTETYLNSGVFALRADAPHWGAWQDTFRAGLERCQGRICCDQTALNYAVWTGKLPYHPLPAVCNWLCHLALPAYSPDDGLFHEPGIPGDVLGILHTADKNKELTVPLAGAHSEISEVSLRFGSARPRNPA